MLKGPSKLAISAMLLFSLTLSSCHNSKKNLSIMEILDTMPVKKLESYTFDPQASIVSRITEAPDFVLQYLNDMDDTDRYTAYTPSKEEIGLVKSYLQLLPPLHQRTAKEKLLGIYFINDFLGSGMTDYVIDNEKNIYSILIINPKTLTAPLSEWMTFRENSCFDGGESPIQISLDCGSEYSGLLYLLLHETAHIVDYAHYITPYTERNILDIFEGSLETATEMTEGIWVDYMSPEEEYAYEYRDDITFYGLNNGPLLNTDDAVQIYSDLMETPFASLYGSKSWAEDYAELLTWYHMTAVLNQPYEIRLHQDGKEILAYSPMESEKVTGRLPALERIYSEKGNTE